MSPRALLGIALLALELCAASCAAPPPARRAYFPFENLRGQVFSAPQVLAGAQREDFGEAPNAIVLALDENSSFRAVTDAVLRLREADLAVGYWIDVRAAPGSSRLDHARGVLRDRPPPDAIFLDGLQGDPLACDCFEAICAAANTAADPLANARLVAALRGFASGAVVVPVWSDGEARLCPEPGCLEARCAERAELAWSAVRADSARVALLLDSDTGAVFAPAVAENLARWSRRSAPASNPTVTLIAVLSGLEWEPGQLTQALSAVRSSGRGGCLVLHCPMPGTSRIPQQRTRR